MNYLSKFEGEISYSFGNEQQKYKFKSISHRDLKPQNIFLLNGQIKIGDFGVSRPI